MIEIKPLAAIVLSASLLLAGCTDLSDPNEANEVMQVTKTFEHVGNLDEELIINISNEIYSPETIQYFMDFFQLDSFHEVEVVFKDEFTQLTMTKETQLIIAEQIRMTITEQLDSITKTSDIFTEITFSEHLTKINYLLDENISEEDLKNIEGYIEIFGSLIRKASLFYQVFSGNDLNSLTVTEVVLLPGEGGEAYKTIINRTDELLKSSAADVLLESYLN